MDNPNDAKYLAELFYNYYEGMACHFDQVSIPVPWDRVPIQNKRHLFTVARRLLDKHIKIIDRDAEVDTNVYYSDGSL